METALSRKGFQDRCSPEEMRSELRRLTFFIMGFSRKGQYFINIQTHTPRFVCVKYLELTACDQIASERPVMLTHANRYHSHRNDHGFFHLGKSQFPLMCA